MNKSVGGQVFAADGPGVWHRDNENQRWS